MKSVVVLGSTGSIGRQALRVIGRLGGRCRVKALACGRNRKLLAEQARQWKPERVALADPTGAADLRRELAGTGVEVLAGADGVLEVARTEADVSLAAIIGSAGVEPTLEAASAAPVLALASKEAVVEGGPLLLARAKDAATTILPVDSEHSAVFQALLAGRREEVRRLILTASGGPFAGLSAAELEEVTPEAALAHPTWEMGTKITVDSATLMNKAFEVVEAHWLFGLPGERIDVLVHRESIVHGMVEFRDGSVIAQMGAPDMALPIQYALTWPDREPVATEPLDLAAVGGLRFEEPDLRRFPALGLGWELIERGGTAPAVAVRSNEVARAAFLRGELAFPRIYEVVRRVLDEHQATLVKGLDVIREAEAWASARAQELVAELTR